MPLYRNGSREESMMHDTLMVTILPFLGATISLLLWSWRAIGPADAPAWGAVAGLGVAILALAASAVVSGSIAAGLQLVACATLLPLFPLQAAFVGSLSKLPGTLPAFLAVVLPCL